VDFDGDVLRWVEPFPLLTVAGKNDSGAEMEPFDFCFVNMGSGVAFTSRVVGVLSFSVYLWAKAGDGDFGVAVNDRL